jgi:hypothetical protein
MDTGRGAVDAFRLPDGVIGRGEGGGWNSEGMAGGGGVDVVGLSGDCARYSCRAWLID